MKLHFEVKEFESQFMNELRLAHEINSSLVPFLLNFPGYEKAINTKDGELSKRNKDPWERGKSEINVFNGFPDIAANLFVQFIKPEFCASKKATPYSFWNSPFYQYKMSEHQQKILDNFSQMLSENLAVICVAPTFHLRSDLVKYARKSLVIDNSNVIRVSKLEKHELYTFNSANRGQDCSWDTKFKLESFNSLLVPLKKVSQKTSFEKNVFKIATVVDAVFKKNEMSG